ncbi:GYDIA family GHMP kinase [Formosa sp. PL04]|uniref:GYDIA family GHMP kinase n=1 Tax=Formosa sp. PL04 TaxID=3081755 RepID=UPI002980C548|nr:GYDIA family GHMP kinase [Formosa sp. PL04]MDW5287932.1 GYDIA family GHMP kinase [Formosa sp. PL04]
MDTFYSNGKLLITAEYLVLNGAEALALPTKFGQSLTVETRKNPGLNWQSFDNTNKLWFEADLNYKNNILVSKTDNELTNRLVSILNTAKTLNPEFLKDDKGYSVKTHLDFPTNWGLGTSSTLINNIANWAKVNPYKLLKLTFGGSGYDIACASNNTPIIYTLADKFPIVKPVTFKPEFSEHIYFVHLNQKQNSREGIAHYKANTSNKSEAIKAVNNITTTLLSCAELNAYNSLIEAHETIIADIVQLQKVKDSLFPEFSGSIKSLGAWGGDFIMVSSLENPTEYFKHKGYHTILPYKDMIL